MFGPPGHAYVYRSYGIHWCLNFVCEEEGVAERRPDPRARADVTGWTRWRARRGTTSPRLLCAGPGRLCQALGITREHDGLPLDRPPFELCARGEPSRSWRGRGSGSRRRPSCPWRYAEAGSRFLSRPIRPRREPDRHPRRGGDAGPRQLEDDPSRRALRRPPRPRSSSRAARASARARSSGSPTSCGTTPWCGFATTSVTRS